MPGRENDAEIVPPNIEARQALNVMYEQDASYRVSQHIHRAHIVHVMVMVCHNGRQILRSSTGAKTDADFLT